MPATEARVERPDLARAGPPSGPELMPKIWLEWTVGQAGVPGDRSRLPSCRSCIWSASRQAPIGREEVQVELVERHLGQVVEVGGHLSGHRVGTDGAEQLGVDAEAVDDHEDTVLVPGFGSPM